MSKKVSVLSLGTRDDAQRFGEQSVALGLERGLDIRKPKPTMEELTSFFGRSDEWIMLASHFLPASGGAAAHMANDPYTAPTVKIEFWADRLKVHRDGASTVLTKGAGFKQHEKIQLVLWGGCNVATHDETIRQMRELFGPHLLIGWKQTTGWQILQAVMGGLDTSPSPHFFQKINIGSALNQIGRAWLETGAATHWGDPDQKPAFSIVEPGGQEWVLSDSGAIQQGRNFG